MKKVINISSMVYVVQQLNNPLKLEANVFGEYVNQFCLTWLVNKDQFFGLSTFIANIGAKTNHKVSK